MACIHSSNVKQEENKVNARFTINHGNPKANVIISSPPQFAQPHKLPCSVTDCKPKRSQSHSNTYIVGGMVTIQFSVDLNYVNDFHGHILLNFNKCYQDDTMEYVIMISSPQLQLSDKYISSNNLMGCPTLLYTYVSSSSEFSFDIDIVLNIKKAPKFSSLYDDNDLTDIELVGEDGSMALHRLVLACQSPVMKTMLTGEWKENKEGRMNALGMSIKALEHLKNYLYLDVLPDTNSDLEPLLDFACRYMMTDLKERCSTKLLFHITAENAMHYTELAMKYKLKKLFFGILKTIQGGNFDLQLIKSSYCGDGWT